LAAKPEWVASLVDLLRVRSRLVDDIVRQATPFFGDVVAYEPEAVAKQWKDPSTLRGLFAAVRELVATHATWTPASLEEAHRALAESKGLGAGKLFQPLRVALTGSGVSPGLFDVMVLLGRERSIARLVAAETYLQGLAAGA
jgi:glutamyl/glutaminyl-tRNA synthetase